MNPRKASELEHRPTPRPFDAVLEIVYKKYRWHTLNTASGFSALRNNTIGASNTAIGASADVSAGNLTNATAIGASARG